MNLNTNQKCELLRFAVPWMVLQGMIEDPSINSAVTRSLQRVRDDLMDQAREYCNEQQIEWSLINSARDDLFDAIVHAFDRHTETASFEVLISEACSFVRSQNAQLN